jgi:hypothetical protein
LKTILKWVLAPVAVIWVLGWAYIQINYPTCTFRYKLTAEVMTPDGVKTGSSVIEVSYQKNGDLFPDARGRHDTLLGEAVYVDLGGGKNLFVTLGTLDAAQPVERWISPLNNSSLREPKDYEEMRGALDPLWLPIKIFKLGRTPGAEHEICQRVSKFYGKTAEQVPLNNLPTLVSFSDLHNPLIARVVKPDDLAAIFGVGYSLAVKIQVTTDNISDAMYDILPWLKSSELNFFPNNKGFSDLARWNFYKFKIPGEASYLAH